MTNLLRIGFLFCCLGSTLLLSAQQSCYEQYLRENNIPLPADNVIENDNSYDELKKEVIARQIMREEAAKARHATEYAHQSTPDAQIEPTYQPIFLAIDTLTGTCHLLAEDGTILANAQLALVDSTWYMWLSVDPLADKYPGTTPYLYCGGNPIMLVDPDGRRPSAYEAALLAACAYDKNTNVMTKRLEGTGWKPSSFPTSISMQNESNGFQSALFEKTVNGVTEYVYAFAGTQLNSIEDWIANLSQLSGYSSQYSEAIQNAQQLSQELSSAELTFVGHSLGGGEAAASSMATGRAAITFNPAAVTTNTVSQEGLLFSDDRITNYRAAGNKLGVLLLGGDILNNLQDNHGLYIPGHTFSIKTGWKPTHGIEDIIQYFQQGL